MTLPTEPKTVLVCYTQALFDALWSDEDSLQDETSELARRIQRSATALVAALKAAGLTAEAVKVPQPSFAPADVSRAAFGWRLLDITASNGVKVDLAVCLDFPAWNVQHPNKICWLLSLPYFVSRRQSGSRPTLSLPAQVAAPGRVLPDQTDAARTVSSLLQAEQRGLSEARRVLTGNREIAQEMSRSGLHLEYNPFPLDLEIDPAGPEWQAIVQRLVATNYVRR